MLACVGLWFPTAVGHVPVDWAAKVSANPLEAQFQLPNAVLGQLIVAIAIAEGLRARLVYSEGHVPGEHGFDPMGFIPNYCNTPEKCAPPRGRWGGVDSATFGAPTPPCAHSAAPPASQDEGDEAEGAQALPHSDDRLDRHDRAAAGQGVDLAVH